MKNTFSHERYHRQLILPGFGEAGQQKLADAHVLVIGAGGLGCPVLQYLAAAGIGHIGIADDDAVSISNLHRQVLYTPGDVGRNKAAVAADHLQRMNPAVVFTVYTMRWQQQQCLDFFSLYDVIVDGSDNFATRYLVNDACVLLGKPLVFGAVSQFEGQLAVFNVLHPDGSRSANYRHLFPDPPKASEVRNCAEAGVLGVLPGIIGTLQATEVIKLVTGMGEILANRLLTYHALHQSFYTLHLPNGQEAIAQMPQDLSSFLEQDYEWLCGVAHNAGLEIDQAQMLQLLQSDALLVDVRERHEQPRLTGWERIEFSLPELASNWDVLEGRKVVFVCQSGKRSMDAAMQLKSRWPDAEVYSLKGGVEGMNN